MYIYASMYMCMCICVNIRMYFLYMYLYMCISLCVCVCVCVCLCVCVCVFVWLSGAGDYHHMENDLLDKSNRNLSEEQVSCVCERERESQTYRKGEKARERATERVRE